MDSIGYMSKTRNTKVIKRLNTGRDSRIDVSVDSHNDALVLLLDDRGLESGDDSLVEDVFQALLC